MLLFVVLLSVNVYLCKSFDNSPFILSIGSIICFSINLLSSPLNSRVAGLYSKTSIPNSFDGTGAVFSTDSSVFIVEVINGVEEPVADHIITKKNLCFSKQLAMIPSIYLFKL